LFRNSPMHDTQRKEGDRCRKNRYNKETTALKKNIGNEGDKSEKDKGDKGNEGHLKWVILFRVRKFEFLIHHKIHPVLWIGAINGDKLFSLWLGKPFRD